MACAARDWLFMLPGAPTNSVLSMVRGSMAAAAFIPVVIMNRPADRDADAADTEEGKRKLMLAALELAVWNALTQGLINAGLLVSDAARASFLMQTSVVLTPVLSTLLFRTRVGAAEWVGCAVALCGVATLSYGVADCAAMRVRMPLAALAAFAGAGDV